MPVDPNNPFAFEIEVEGQEDLKNALARGEKGYIRFAVSINKTAEALEEQSKQHEKAGESAKKHGRILQRLGRGLVNMGRKFKRFAVGLVPFRRTFGFLRKQANDVGLSFSNLAGILGGATLLGAIVGAAKAFIQWDNQLRELTTTMSAQPKLMAAVGSSARALAVEFGVSRDEVLQVTKAMGELHLVAGDTPKSVAQFKSLRKTVFALGRAMDVSTLSVVDMFDQFKRVYGLPHHRLRGIAASMKFIQEQTGISGQELIEFGKSMEDVLARMAGVGADAKADVTRDMLAMAGVLKQAGVEARELPGLFAETLRLDSERGPQWLAFLEQQTGVAMDRIKTMIETGDIVTPTELFIRSLRRLGPRGIKEQESWLTEMTGMTFSTLVKMSKVNEKSLRGMVKASIRAEKRQEQLQKKAMARQNRLTRMWNRLKEAFTTLWLKVGQVVVAAATRMARFAIPVIRDGIKKLEAAFKWITSPEGGEAIVTWLKDTWKSVKELAPIFVQAGKGASWFFDKVKILYKMFKEWNPELKTTLKYVAGAGGLIASMWALKKVVGILGGKVTLIVAGLTALYVGAQKIANWISERQAEEQKSMALAKETSRSIRGMIRGTKREKIGFLKAEMMGKEAVAGKNC